MNDRLVTLFGGMLALVAVILLLVPPPAVKPDDLSLPTSEDRGAQGLAGLRLWLDKMNIPVYSLRERYGALITEPALPETGNLLITSLPQRAHSRYQEQAELSRWLSQGNSILLLMALSDWPDWAGDANRDVFSLPRRLGFEPQPPVTESKNDSDSSAATLPEVKKKAQNLVPAGPYPLLEGIKRVKAYWLTSEQPTWRLVPLGSADRSVVVLLTGDNKEPAFWQVRVGQGRAWISRHAELFGNRALGEADNARFAMRLIHAALGADGHVIFDDRHQGLSVVYDPEAFYSDPRLRNTVLFLLALWLIYLLGHTNRFIPSAPRAPAMSIARELRAVGGFFARRVRPRAVAERLFHHFHNDMRLVFNLPRNGQPAWDCLERHASLEPGLIDRLRSLEQRTESGQRVNLRELINTMERIKESLK